MRRPRNEWDAFGRMWDELLVHPLAEALRDCWSGMKTIAGCGKRRRGSCPLTVARANLVNDGLAVGMVAAQMIMLAVALVTDEWLVALAALCGMCIAIKAAGS